MAMLTVVLTCLMPMLNRTSPAKAGTAVSAAPETSGAVTYSYFPRATPRVDFALSVTSANPTRMFSNRAVSTKLLSSVIPRAKAVLMREDSKLDRFAPFILSASDVRVPSPW